MVAMDVTEEACQWRIIHDISKVVNWVRVRDSVGAEGAKDVYL